MTRLALLLVIVAVTHLIMARPTEPFFFGDETRHVMTGIFVADAITDGGILSPKTYAERYYAQYPALGLIVWPPGFYAVEGMAMLIFGRDFETGRWLTVAYCLLACGFLYRLVSLTHDCTTALLATSVFAFSREVFFFSRNVMLEVPTTAFVLMAIYFLERYLRDLRGRHLFWCSLGCILAGLHRYDAVVLMIYVALRLTFAGKWRLVRNRMVVVAIFAVFAVLAPVYLHAMWEIGGVQSVAATHGTDPLSVRSNRFDQYTYLLATLWAQIGHAACGFAIIGLLLSLRRASRAKSAPYWSIALATWLFFAPMADQQSRHGMYWIAAWALWAADAAIELANRMPNKILKLCIPLALIFATAFWTLKQPVPWVRGYYDAAGHALRAIPHEGVVLFEGHLSGTMAYTLRTQDAARRLWLLRADKLFYAALSNASLGYTEWTGQDDEALNRRLAEIAPDLIIVESPRARQDAPMARRLRELLASHPDYELVATLPVENNNVEWLDGVKLLIYRPKRPRPPGERPIAIPMLWQGRTIETVIPGR